MLRTGFFDSTAITQTLDGYPQGNKAESADFFSAFWSAILGNGIPYTPTSNFYVAADGAMNIKVSAGKCYRSAYMAWDESDTTITIPTSTSARTLYVGVRLDAVSGEFTDGIAVRSTFDGDTDIVFAIITIPANAVTVTSAMIQDVRSSVTYCGYVNDVETRLADLETELRRQIQTIIAGGVPNHASTHAHNGDDPVTPAAIGAAALDANSKVTPAQASARSVDVSVSKTLALTDAGTRQRVVATSAITITVPPDSTVAWPDDTEIEILQLGAGMATFAAGTGVSISSDGPTTDPRTMSGQYTGAALVRTGSNAWALIGALA